MADALNFVYTSLANMNAGDYLITDVSSFCLRSSVPPFHSLSSVLRSLPRNSGTSSTSLGWKNLCVLNLSARNELSVF